MPEVNVRELRNHGGRVLERVASGETITVTLDGRPVAELRPLPARPLSAARLLERWRGVPLVDAAKLRSDIDAVMEPGL